MFCLVVFIQIDISKSTVCKTIQRYEANRHVKNFTRTGSPKLTTNEESKVNMLLAIEENPQVSSGQLALYCDIISASIRNSFKLQLLKPYKIEFVHELLQGDPDHRVQFCETDVEVIISNPNLLGRIVFSDGDFQKLPVLDTRSYLAYPKN